MVRFIMPIILIGIAIAVFIMFSNPFYKKIGELNVQVASYNKALDNFSAFDHEKDLLTQKNNSISLDDKIKLQKLLPNNVDNIRLILEIEQVAMPYGMGLKDIKYSSPDDNKSTTTSIGTTATQRSATATSPKKDYGIWDLSFSTTGTYNNFLNFMRDLESNLRIVDISSIQFSSDAGNGSVAGPNPSSSYKYDFKIKTYWLKN